MTLILFYSRYYSLKCTETAYSSDNEVLDAIGRNQPDGHDYIEQRQIQEDTSVPWEFEAACEGALNWAADTTKDWVDHKGTWPGKESPWKYC